MKAEEIFAQAIEMTANEQRDAFVASACGTDAALLAKVQDLLKAHDEASQFLEQSLFESPPPSTRSPAKAPAPSLAPISSCRKSGMVAWVSSSWRSSISR